MSFECLANCIWLIPFDGVHKNNNFQPSKDKINLVVFGNEFFALEVSDGKI